MSVLTILAFLFGSRNAIERVVADPWAVWVGLALVLSAGLARSYRTRDLCAQPWHLVLPVVVSLLLTLLLYAMLAVKLTGANGGPAFAPGLRSVAAVVFLTAPLAWLYAIPYERFLSWPRAVRARLLTLAIVATWRVALTVRALAVLLDDRLALALCLVLTVTDALALAGLILPAVVRAATSRPRGLATPMLLGVMSGIDARAEPSHEPGRDLVRFWTVVVALLGVVSLPAWIVGLDKLGASAARWQELLTMSGPASAPGVDVWILVAAPLVFFMVLLPWTQRRPRLRTRVEWLLRGGQEREALRLMSAHGAAAFPPGWIPPPEDDFRDPPRLLELVDAVTREPHADWVREVYVTRFRGYLSDLLWYWFYDEDLEKVVAILSRLPDGPDLARRLLAEVPAFEAKARLLARLGGLPGEEPDAPHLHPEPQTTERRPAIVAELESLARRLEDKKRPPGNEEPLDS
jgi:hypothetical protein